MLFLQGGRSEEFCSYTEPVNWPLRKYADEQSLSDLDALFHGASQENDETEREFFLRVRGQRRLCQCIHTERQMKSRSMQRLGGEIRVDVREHKTGNMRMDRLLQ